MEGTTTGGEKMATESEGRERERELRAFPRPPFPVFPFVMPLMFPIGFVALLIILGSRRQRTLEARLAEIQEKIEDLAGKLSAGRE
jgi:hypothetical protein